MGKYVVKQLMEGASTTKEAALAAVSQIGSGITETRLSYASFNLDMIVLLLSSGHERTKLDLGKTARREKNASCLGDDLWSLRRRGIGTS